MQAKLVQNNYTLNSSTTQKTWQCAISSENKRLCHIHMHIAPNFSLDNIISPGNAIRM